MTQSDGPDAVSKRRAHCNSCGGYRNHRVHFETAKDWEAYDVYDQEIEGRDEYYVLECLGCEDIRLLHISLGATNVQYENVGEEHYYPPAESRRAPDWLHTFYKPALVRGLLQEVYRAIQNDAPSLAVMGIRALVEAIMIDKVGDNETFNANLTKFHAGGYVSETQKQTLLLTLEIGHASIHRGFKPADDQLQFCLDTVENLVHGLYVLQSRLGDSSRHVPKRNR